ncbi:MAG: rhomboid family intramembrane serine protease [Pirellulales bacterium]|nr:rhomboid family intramembrane serine protease [Pirellulales bacterium]
MGLYDREYGRHSEPGVHLSAPQSITNKVVIITACAYGLQLFVESFTSWFVLSDGWFYQPWNAYRLLSYGFLHAPNYFRHIVINMLVFWMFGQELERKYGPREFLWLYLWAIVFAGLAWSLIEAGNPGSQAMLGASGGVSAIFALYALNFPHRQILFMFIIPMPMWLAAAIAIIVDINSAMDRSGNIAGSAHLAGAIAGLYYYKLGFSPGRWLADRFSGFSPKLPRSRPNLRIHEPTEQNREMDRQVDAILKKIQDQGQESLTASERRLLEKASREYQRKQH